MPAKQADEMTNIILLATAVRQRWIQTLFSVIRVGYWMCVWGLFQPGYYSPLDVASVDLLAAQIFRSVW